MISTIVLTLVLSAAVYLWCNEPKIAPPVDRYINMAYQWRTTTPESVMSTEEILEEALRILRSERASTLQSSMEVAPDKVYGVDNATFQDRKNWE